MASLKRRSNNHFINENGENLFELALPNKLHLNIITSDGWNVCSNLCKKAWEGQ